MANSEKLYIAKEDLFRFGSAASSNISKPRPKEITTIEVNGVLTIVANGRGISLFNKAGLDKSRLTGWVWEIKQGTVFPAGLKLIKDNSSTGHHTLTPIHNMPLSQYIGLLEQVAVRCQKTFKKQA